MDKKTRDERLQAVPRLRDGVEAAFGAPARKLLRVQETKLLVRNYRDRLKAEVAKWDLDQSMERLEADYAHGTTGSTAA